MHYTDIITKKEAEALGIIGNDGLGFIKPQTAFKNITEQILAEIKKGNLVWRKGWRSGVVIKGKTYGAQNYETQRPYTGGNAFFINMQNLLNGTDYRFFLTHKQIKERGASLKQGAKPFPVSVFIKNVTTKEIVVKGEKKEINTEEAGVIWYYVYPIDLVDGLKEIKRITNKPDTFDEIVVTDAETIINNMPKAPPIKHGGNEAYWTPDRVQMPLKKAFKIPQQYYSTLFHELTHSTGYKTRLDRDMSGKFGSKPYALEELIAEISAAYLCGVCEIDYYTINNSAAYLKSWANRLLTEIESDPNFLKRAVFKATRAATFIIGKTLEKHGIVVKLGSEKEVVKPEEKPHKGKEITPNKTVKASVNKAIEDLMNTNKELKKIGAMALGMLYSSYKNNNFPDTNEGLKGKLFEKMEQQGIVEYMTRYELTEYGSEIVKKIEARLETLKAKKSGTDLFPELAGITDGVLIFINAFLSTHNKTVSKEELLYILTTFQTAIKNGLVKAKHPLSAVANTTQNKLVALINKLSPNEKIILNISNKNIIENKISSLQGLGFWNVIASAVIGKSAEYFANKALTKNNTQSLSGIDEYEPIYTQFKNKGKEAIKYIMKVKKGDAQKALYRKDIGFIDIVWGKNNPKTNVGYGLKHIIEKHGKEIKELGFNVEDFIPLVVNTGIFKKSKIQNRIILEGKMFKIVVDTKYQGKPKNFVLTAFDLRQKSFSGINQTVDGINFNEAPLYTSPDKLVINIQKKSKQNNLSGVMSVTDAINSKYDLIGLDGDYLKLIGEACKPTSFFIYGPGGSGKSSFTLLFSNYMAKKGNKMLYVAGEQFATPVFSKMLQRLKIEDSSNFVIVKSIATVPLKGFDFIVIDSKDSLNFELNDFIALKKNNPNLSFVILSQATKDGGFTGSEKWRNEVDTLLYCEDLIVHSNMDKNRWGGSAQFQILKIK